VYFILEVFREKTGGQKILNRLVAIVPQNEFALNFCVNATLICSCRYVIASAEDIMILVYLTMLC